MIKYKSLAVSRKLSSNSCIDEDVVDDVVPAPGPAALCGHHGTITVINSSNIPNQGTSSYLDTDSDYRITYRVFNNETIATLALKADRSVPVTGGGGGGGEGSVLSPGLLAVDGVHLNGSRVVPCPEGPPEMTEDMKFTDEKFMMVIVYCCIFIVAAVGNLTVFITLFRNR